MGDLEDYQVACIQPKKQQNSYVIFKNYIFACDFDPFIFSSSNTIAV